MKKLIFIFVLLSKSTYSQNELRSLLKKYNTENIPYISVDSLKKITEDIILLDAREKKEFDVSHLKDALFVGYEKFDIRKTMNMIPDKKSKIVVYCSLGVRSEDVAEKLKKTGYIHVFNLYGGIFEWKNNDNKVFTSKNIETEKVHTCTAEWSKWLLKGEKVYE
ncbi:MAG: rhodanese-like domain-containing protein [Flavobacteriaceae bacterium]|nr:MAG: rhodanese-like domain-containing protein [Flavobacteriaceae bacterium]